MQVQLVMFKADGQRKEFSPRKDKTIIGRAIECDFQIPLAMVSRRHCQITLEEDSIIVRDLGSSNGTYVNQKRIQEARLKAADQLVVGPVTFTVIVDGEPSEVNAVRTAVAPGTAVSPDLEMDGGTVDVEAEQNGRGAVKADSEAEVVEAVEEIPEPAPVVSNQNILEIHDGPAAPQEEEEPLPEDPLAALEAMSRPKRSPK